MLTMSEDVMDDAEAAFGANPTLAARGRYLQAHGRANYTQMMRLWGASEGNLRPGTRPNASGTPGDQADRKREAAEANSNPWHPAYKGRDRIQRQVTIIKSMGTAAAAKMAKSAGVTLSGKPLNAR